MTINAKIEGGTANVEYEVNGRKRIKKMALESLALALQSCSKADKSCTLNPPFLRVQGTSSDSLIVGYELPERVGSMPFTVRERGDGDRTNIKFNSVWPWGLTLIKFTKTPGGYSLNQYFQFALKGPIVSMDTQLYCWPGSNVYDDHRCCIGRIDVPKIQTVEQTGGLPFIFYNGISNTDLQDGRFTPFTKNGSTIKYPVDLYKSLAVKDGELPAPFPYDILRPAMTLGKFLEGGGFK